MQNSKPKTFRISVPATVEFEVEAHTEVEAWLLGEKLVRREGGEATHTYVISAMADGQAARNQAVYLNLEDLARDVACEEVSNAE